MLHSRGLLGYWPLENSALDASGNGNNLSLNGCSYSAGRFGRGLSMNGSGDFATVSPDGFGTFNCQAFTISLWIKTPTNWGAVGDYRILWSYDQTSHSPPYYAQHLRLTSGDPGGQGILVLGWNDGSFQVLTSPSPLSTDTWHHILAIYESGRQEIWDNGTLIASSTLTGHISYFHKEVCIGKANFAVTKDIPGIDEVSFFNHTLTHSDIHRVMMSMSPIN